MKKQKEKNKTILSSKHHKNNHNTTKSMKQCNGITLEQYSEEKELPISFLKKIGITEIKINEEKKLSIPYHNINGDVISTRYLKNLEGKDKYDWKKGSEPLLYGLERLDEAIKKEYVVLAQSESDCQTLWYHKIPAIGIPSGTSLSEDRDAHYLSGIKKIYLLRGKDDGIDNIIDQLKDSSINDRIKILQIKEFKNLAKMHIRHPNEFKGIIKEKFESAKSLKNYIRTEQRKKLYAKAKKIAEAENIMDMFVEDIKKKEMVGEEILVKVLYLTLTTRLFDDPVCVYVKGNSSTGKSCSVGSVLKYFPFDAHFELTSASERALIHSKENFKNRFIVIYEEAGVGSAFLDLLIRTLISEKQIIYPVNDKTIKKEGPTGFITTTTGETLRNKENETRYLQFTSDDSIKQNRAVVLSKAKKVRKGSGKKSYDWETWLAFQEWLALSKTKYAIPYAVSLAKLINCDVSRIRRDVDAVYNLIGAHAVIHQKNREINSEGIVIANRKDYEAVYNIIAKALSSPVGASHSDVETVNKVKRALKELKLDSISMTDLSDRLGVHRATVSRNVVSPIAKGYLVNQETKKGVEAKLAIGKHIKKNIKILPSPKTLWAYIKERKTKKK